MDIIFQAVSDSLTFQSVLYICIGIVVGVIVGAIPGLNGGMAIALCIPLTYYMGPVEAIGFLIGINKAGTFGGSIASILINTPGSPESTATCFDGYPLAVKGEGVRALKVSLYSSFFGDTMSALSLCVVAGSIASLALKLSPLDLFWIVVFSLVLVSGLESGDICKGLISCAMGMLIACIGLDTFGQLRFVFFGSLELSNGIPLLAVAIGTMAVSEIIYQMQGDLIHTESAAMASHSVSAEKKRLYWWEIKKLIPTCLRSSLIGVTIGALPGLGATMAAFLGYGTAKSLSNHPEEFGKGALEGIAAPEAANNAVIGANLIPLLTLGIPGNVNAAFIMGALILHGVTIGPLLFEENPRLIYGIYVMVFAAGCFNLIISRFGMHWFFKVLSVRRTVLFPAILSMCLIGSYLGDLMVFSVGSMLVLAALGFLMRKYAYSFVTFLIGFVLAPILESTLQQSLLLCETPYTFFMRPIPIICIVGSLLVIIRALRRSSKKTFIDDIAMPDACDLS